MSKAVEAAKAYVQRIGFELLDETVTPDSFLARDGNETVLILTSVSYEPGVESPGPREIPQVNANRVDLIRLLVIAEDRALLRHEKGFSLGKEQ